MGRHEETYLYFHIILNRSYKWINKPPNIKGNGGILVQFLTESNRTLPIKWDDRINIV
jgi:hypothetical protein